MSRRRARQREQAGGTDAKEPLTDAAHAADQGQWQGARARTHHVHMIICLVIFTHFIISSVLEQIPLWLGTFSRHILGEPSLVFRWRTYLQLAV